MYINHVNDMNFLKIYFQIAHFMLHLIDDSTRTLWPVINVGLDLGEVVDLLGKSCQLRRLKVHASTSLGPLQLHGILVLNY